MPTPHPLHYPPPLHHRYYTANGVLLIYDVANDYSYMNTKDVFFDWGYSDTVFLLVGNMCLLSGPREVPTKKAKAFADEESMMFVETSVRDRTSFDTAFLDFVRGKLCDGVLMVRGLLNPVATDLSDVYLAFAAPRAIQLF